MEYGIADDDAALIKKIFASFPCIKSVVLFGSRAMGRNKPGSDIDFAIVADKMSFTEFLDLEDQLAQIGMLIKIDIQDLSKIKDAEVLGHISQVGKVFYTKDETSA